MKKKLSKKSKKIDLDELTEDQLYGVLKDNMDYLCEEKIGFEKMKKVVFAFMQPVVATFCSFMIFDAKKNLPALLGLAGVMAVCSVVSAQKYDRKISEAKKIQGMLNNLEYDKIAENYADSKDKDFKFFADASQFIADDATTQIQVINLQKEKDNLPDYREIFKEFDSEGK